MERVKRLPSLSAPWAVGKRQAHELFMFDSVAEIKGVGPTATNKLVAAGINTVAELVAKDPTTHVDGINTATLAKFVARGKTARQGGFPEDRIINHKLMANPYKSLHGDQWQVVIATTTAMQKYACITELVEHMVHASAAVFKGTEHAFTWMMVHDALSLMTSIECRAWMGSMQLKGPTPAKDRTFLDCWVLPKQGLNAGTVYANRPPGNCPELMCWDASLNKDVDDAVARHVAATSHLAVGDDLRFSRATPVVQTKAFLRVLAGSPTSERIVQDVKRVLPSLLTIQLKRGSGVQGQLVVPAAQALAFEHLAALGDREFKKMFTRGFRVNRSMFKWLEEKITPYLNAIVIGPRAFSVQQRMVCTLRWLGGGA
jgi:hypothetical protein